MTSKKRSAPVRTYQAIHDEIDEIDTDIARFKKLAIRKSFDPVIVSNAQKSIEVYEDELQELYKELHEYHLKVSFCDIHDDCVKWRNQSPSGCYICHEEEQKRFKMEEKQEQSVSVRPSSTSSSTSSFGGSTIDECVTLLPLSPRTPFNPYIAIEEEEVLETSTDISAVQGLLDLGQPTSPLHVSPDCMCLTDQCPHYCPEPDMKTFKDKVCACYHQNTIIV
jgi:hypothetical protein